MDGRKLLKNIIVTGFFLGNGLLCMATKATKHGVSDDFWVNDLGRTLEDKALWMERRGLVFDEMGKLHWAVEFENIELVERLLEEDANPNRRYDGNQTSIHVAAGKYSSDIVRLLLNHGASHKLKDDDENTPLHIAAGHALMENVKLLLDNDANPNSKNEEGQTPLMMAVNVIFWAKDIRLRKMYRCFSIMKLLVDHSANVNAQDNKGNTALHLAVNQPDLVFKCSNPELLKLLIAMGTNFRMLKLLIELGADVNIQNEHGETALDLAQQLRLRHCDKQDIDEYDRYIAALQKQNSEDTTPNEENVVLLNAFQREREELSRKMEMRSNEYDSIIALLREHGAMEGQPGDEMESQSHEEHAATEEAKDKTEDASVDGEN
jgi:ankyrin repeat protein